MNLFYNSVTLSIKFERATYCLKKILFVLLLNFLFFNTKAQRPSVDSLYKKGTLGVGLIVSPSASINTFFIKNYNIYSIDAGLSLSYFFKNRWSVYGSFQNHRRFSNRPERSPSLSFVFGDMQVRYHLRNWYFGAGNSLGNFSFIDYFEGDTAPRTTWIAFANTGLNVRTSTHKKFWKDTFFVVDFKIGKALYVEQKPDGLSSTDGIRPSGYIGLRYHFNRKNQ